MLKYIIKIIKKIQKRKERDFSLLKKSSAQKTIKNKHNTQEVQNADEAEW